VRDHGTDPLARSARTLLAWAALERNDFGVALTYVGEVERGPAGAVRDRAVVIEGAVLRRSGHPHEALQRLLPLQGKLVDPQLAELFHPELVAAALQAKDWIRVVGLLDAWLTDAQPDDR